MTLTQLIPVPRLAFRRSRHRAVDEVDRQRAMRAGADRLIAGLRLQLDEQDIAHAATVARLEARYTATIARLDAHYGATIRQLEAELADARRRLEIRNWADSVVTQTQEIDTRGLREKFAAGPVVSLHHSPQATTRAVHRPSWATTGDEDTQPIPAA